MVDYKFTKEPLVSYSTQSDHKFFSNGVIALGSTIAVTTLHANNEIDSYTYPIMCEPISKENGKNAENTAAQLIDFFEKTYGDCTKEWS